MKVNSSSLHVYTIQRPRSPVAPRESQPVQAPPYNKLSQARFADLLSAEEKAFIAKNFKTEGAAQSDAPQLGRFLDVVA
jgi:hypothetical protein